MIRSAGSIKRDYQDGRPIMKKLGMLGIIGGAALLTASPLSLQWSQKNMALSLVSAEAQSGPLAVGLPFSLSPPTSCGYIPYGTSYAAPCGIYSSSSSYAQAYERLQAAATAAPYGYSYAAPYSYYDRPATIGGQGVRTDDNTEGKV
jgi:hypothetical protein